MCEFENAMGFNLLLGVFTGVFLSAVLQLRALNRYECGKNRKCGKVAVLPDSAFWVCFIINTRK